MSVGYDTAPPALAALEVTRRLVSGPLREVVAGLHPDLARVCGYHAGWCDADGRPAKDPPGKLLRATLALLGARAVGAEAGAAVAGAVAVELIHDFSLLHDDIMDADERRRGRPAAWVVFGAGLATLAGDALIAAAFQHLRTHVPGQGRVSPADLLTTALSRMIDGQAADLALEGFDADEVDVAHYLRACDKTTALLEAALGIGAALGGASPDETGPLCRAGRNLALSWQMANDVEDIWGDPARIGKPARSDLRRSKKTIPVICALRAGNEAAALLRAAIRATRPDPTDAALQEQAALIDRAGGREQAERLSRRYLDAALADLAVARLPPDVRSELAHLFRFVVRRGA